MNDLIDSWPLDNPPDLAVITLCGIVEDGMRLTVEWWRPLKRRLAVQESEWGR